MGRYDSPLSVATLFLVATVVSVGLIFLFDAETESRIEKHSTEISSSTANTKGIVHNSIPSQHHDTSNYNNNNNNKNNWDRDEHLQSYTDQGSETHPRTKGEGSAAHGEDVTNQIPSATHHEGSGSIFSYFGGKIKDLFRRQHRVRKRSLDEDSNPDTDVEFDGVLNSEWSDSEEDKDGPIDPIALPLQELPNQSLKRKAGEEEDEETGDGESGRDKNRVVPLPLSTIVKRDANFDSSQNVNSKSHHTEDGNLNVISRNMNTNTNVNPGNGNILGGESGKSSYPGFGYISGPGPGPGPALMSPSPVSSAGSSSSGFHKIRHAIRKLGGGGLDLSMVERMILDSNPGRFRASSETQDVEHRSNYHVSPPNRNSNNNHNHKNSESRSGFHPPDTHPPYHFPFPEQQSRQQQQQQQQAQTHVNSRGQEEDERRPSPRERGKEKLHDDTDTSSPGLSNRGNSRGSHGGGGGGGGDGGGHSNSSPFSSRSRGGESSSNRHWKSTDNNHNLSSNDNENDNSFERDRRGSSTSASLLQPRFPSPSTTSASWFTSSSYPSSTAVSTFPDALSRYGSGSAGSLGAAVGENSSSHHGRGGSGHSSGPNQSTDSRQANFNSNSNMQRKKLSSLHSLSPALSSLMEDSNPNESTDFHHEKREQEQDVLNGRKRKTNDANSRLEFPTAPHPRQDSASAAFHFENGAAVESQVDFNDERDLESHTNANYHHHDHHHHHQKQQQRHETGDSTSKRKNHGSESSNSMDLINMGGDGVIGIAIDAVRDVHVDREGKQTTHITDTKRSIIKEDVQVCYKTDDVLIVVAITCCLNFAFVLVVWGCVRWFSISSTAKERDFHHLDCEDGGDSILFHEEQDHEEPCWRAPSPMALDFDRPDKFEHGEDCCLEQVTSSKCRRSSRDCISHQHTHHHHHQQQHHHVVGQEKCQIMQEQSGRAGARMSPASCGNPSPSSSPPLFTSSFPMCDEMVVMPRESARSLVSSLRKPSDRFHFFRQKQYQKNLKEFGLGFGPPLSTVSNYSKNISRVGAGVRGGAGGTRLSSASMYSFQTSDVPHHLQHQQQQQQYHHHHDHQSPQQFQLLKNTINRQKSYSHSMEDLRYIHT